MPRLDFALLAGAAAGPPDGLVYILGGGFDTINTLGLPAVLTGSLVLRIARNRSEVQRPFEVEIQLNDQDGNAVLPQPIRAQIPPQGVPPGLPAHWEVSANLVLGLIGLQLPRAGLYSIEILLGGSHVKTLPLRVELLHQLPPGLLQLQLPPGQ